MENARVALIQMRLSTGKQYNLSRAKTLVAQAAKQGCKIVCLPEHFNSSYIHDGDLSSSEGIPGQSSRLLQGLARQWKIAIVGGSILEREDGHYYNTSLVIGPQGRILGKYRKTHLWLNEAKAISAGANFPIFDVFGINVGVMICRDLVYPEVARILKVRGAQIIFCPSAVTDDVLNSNHVTLQSFQAFTIARAMENCVYVALASACGEIYRNNNETKLMGHSMFAGPPFGKVKECRYAEQILTVTLQLSRLKTYERRTKTMERRRVELRLSLRAPKSQMIK